jgi:N-acetylglucosaminyldiphosphoundecaprenol N-acetyl-beta-D-mannosaminyltransferase
MKETLQLAENSIKKKAHIHHGVLNAAKLVNALRNPDLRNSILSCDIINADGKAIVWAAKFLNQPVPERVTGIDLMEQLVKVAAKNQFKIFFFGAKENIARRVVEKYSNEHGPQIIAGYRNGYYSKSEEPLIAEDIGRSDADILFVAMTSPAKEIFLDRYKDKLNVPFIMGVGGSFDVVAGLVKRAPMWMQKIGLEWFYRVCQEPRRLWKRYLITNSLFIYYIAREKFFPNQTRQSQDTLAPSVNPTVSAE